jgi:parallel beta-helix repeat protein
MMLSTVDIIAAGTTGQEVIELAIAGQTVATYNQLGSGGFDGQYQTLTYTTAETLTADDVRIQFTNDVWDPANGIDRNVRIDAIVIDGVRYETEDSSVFSTGTWSPSDGVQPGFGRGEYLHTDGYIQYAGGGGSSTPISINAAGAEGTESFALQIDGQTVQTWTNIGTDFIRYNYAANGDVTADQIRVVFFNDQWDPANGIDSNLIVDNINVGGVTYETEAANVFSTGTWLPDDGIAAGFGRGDTLNGNGYFQFSSQGVVDPPVDSTYLLTPTRLTWQQAEDYAQEVGGHLVTINDAAEDSFLQSTFGTDQSFWTGLNDIATEGNFVWSSGESVTYTNFAPGEPNDFRGNQDAVVINFTSDKLWDDHSAANRNFGIVEVPVTSPPVDNGVTYFVATNGSDSFDEGQSQDRSTPWRTIQRAVDAAQAGDTIIVADGTYNEEIFLKNDGNQGEDIVLRSENRQGARLLGFISGRGISHITVDGFDITNSRENGNTKGIAFYESHHVTIKNNLVRDSFGGGISVDQSDWILIEGNTTHDNAALEPAQHSGISVFQPQYRGEDDRAWGIVIRNNVSYNNINLLDNPNCCGRPTDGSGIVLDDFLNSQASGNGVVYERRTLVENNITHSNGGHGIHVYRAQNIDIRNNTSVGNLGNLTFGGEVSVQQSERIRIYNNILSARPGESAAQIFDSNDISIEYNLVNGPISGLESSATNLYTAPDFETGTLRLRAGAAGVNQGIAQDLPTSFDLSGQNRVVGTVDIGAFERQDG